MKCDNCESVRREYLGLGGGELSVPDAAEASKAMVGMVVDLRGQIVAMRKALEKIRSKAHLLAFARNLGEEAGREAGDIFWLAVAALEGREKASALGTFTALSGIPTDDPERMVGGE